MPLGYTQGALMVHLGYIVTRQDTSRVHLGCIKGGYKGCVKGVSGD